MTNHTPVFAAAIPKPPLTRVKFQARKPQPII